MSQWPMRREKRAVSDVADILQMVDACQVMHLGLCQQDQPYVVPLNYGWEWQDGVLTLYFHAAREGRKADMIRHNGRCHVTLTGPFTLQTADNACGWSGEYWSVMGQGTVSLIEDEPERIHALDTIMRHYGHPGKPAYQPGVLARTALYRIRCDEVTAKRAGS